MSKKIFFDVGANDGSSSIYIAENEKETTVYAFEPTPRLISILKEKTSHLRNYIIIPKAVSNFNGREKFYIAGNNDWGCSSLLNFSNKSKTEWPGRTDFVVTEEVEVDVIRLDDFMEENGIKKIDYLHIDTQGSDLKVLEGLGTKILSVREGVMEAANKKEILYNEQNYKTDCVEFLQTNGLEVTNIRPNDHDMNEVNIFFKKIKKMKIIKQYIVTYNNTFQINKCLNSLFDSLDDEQLSMLEINIINNDSNFSIEDKFKNKVNVLHNTLRPDFSTGHLSRNWNQAIINGFGSILEPQCDILITCQDDCEFSENYINKLIEHHKTYSFIQQGHGDEFISYTINSIKRIGLWDERFCTIGFHELDYYVRAIKYNFEKTSINDYFHNKNINNIDNLDLIKPVLCGFERNETYHKESEVYFHVCSHLMEKKWGIFWEFVFYQPRQIVHLQPQIPSYVFYPYFERYVETLKEQKFVLQNDRIC